MANIYVRSTDGSNADDGSTWALAKATLAGASAIAVAGDVVWVSQAHSESTAAPVTLIWTSTKQAPVRIFCGNDAAEPPTALATTAVMEVTGNSKVKLGASSLYVAMYGITVRWGGGTPLSPVLDMNETNGQKLFEKCTFESASTGSNADANITIFNGWAEVICKDCNFKFNNTSQSISATESPASIVGGALLAGSTPVGLFKVGDSASIFVAGFDMSSVGTGINLSDTTFPGAKLLVSHSRLPASWTGSVNSVSLNDQGTYELVNTATSGSAYRYQQKTQFGIIDNNATVVRTGGASDGIKPTSWKLVTNADAEWSHHLLESAHIVRWNNTVGSAITVTIEILHDSLTNMTDQQIWMEVRYLGTSGSPLSSFINDSSGSYLSTAADQAASSASWTTTGLVNPNTQKLHVTCTPQEKGFLTAVVCMAKASKTVYVCPKLEIS